MQFLSSLLGGSENAVLSSVFALGAVLVLVVLGLWLLKLVTRSGTMIRSRGRRLQMIEQIQVDQKRQLLIIRRDNVEHLILTGGPQDLVVETDIPVVEKPAQPLRRPAPAVKRPPAQQMPVQPPVAQPQPQPRTADRPQAEEPAAVEPPRPAVIRPNMERIKGFSRPVPPLRTPSLRHTGLLRPVSVMEPAVIPMPSIVGDNSGRSKVDSATNAQGLEGNGRTSLGAQRNLGEPGTAEK